MNVINTISYDSKYSKEEVSEVGIKQQLLDLSRDNNFIEKATKTIDDNLDKTIKTLDDSNKYLEVFDRKLEISIHEKTKEIMVKVIDTSTDEVIREIPPEKVLDTIAYRKEILGVLMDKKI